MLPQNAATALCGEAEGKMSALTGGNHACGYHEGHRDE